MPLFTAFDAQQLVEKEQERLRTELNKQLEDDLATVFTAIERAAAQGQTRVRIRGLQNRTDAEKAYLASLGYTVTTETIVRAPPELPRTVGLVTWGLPPAQQIGSPVELAPDEIFASQDVAFETRFFPTGGIGPFTFSLVDGWIPPGLSWGSLTNQTVITLSGTPTRTGVGYFILQVTDQYNTPSRCRVEWAVTAVEEDPGPQYAVDYVDVAADQTQAVDQHLVVTAGLPPGFPQTYYDLTLTVPAEPINGEIIGVSILANPVNLTISADTVPAVTDQLTQPNTVQKFVYRSQNATWYLI
jgi:hypothetical protein